MDNLNKKDVQLAVKQESRAWARAVEVDASLRVPGNVVNRNMDQALYVHRACLPLPMVDIEGDAEKKRRQREEAGDLFRNLDCGEGMCGV